MTDDGQERFEDYLELERYIEDLQAGRAAHLPQHLTPEQARIYRIAAQFCSASPGADEPSEQFVSKLEAHLLDQLQEEITEKHATVVPEQETPQVAAEAEPVKEKTQPVPWIPQVATEVVPAQDETQPVQEVPQVATEVQPVQEKAQPVQDVPQIASKTTRRIRFISRRAMLTGGAVAAASLAIGTGIGEKLGSAANKPAAATNPVDKQATSTPDESGEYGQPWLVGSASGLPTTWHFVTTLAQLGNQAVQFAAGGVVGYVILKAGSQTEQTQPSNEVIAISAACTHMGCIVQWQNSDRRFHCPCHSGMFTQNGQPDPASPMRYLAALPRLHVKIDKDNNIFVEVPKIE